ncbi:hypothetical protein KCU93_g6975, partial [Aureobasidium melanogenum]
MTPRSVREQQDDSESPSTQSTSSHPTDENGTTGSPRSTVERFLRHIDAYTKVLDAIENDLHDLTTEKATLITAISSPEVLEFWLSGSNQAPGLARVYWTMQRSISERETKLENQLSVLKRWVDKLRVDFERFVKDGHDTGESEGGSRDEDMSDAA